MAPTSQLRDANPDVVVAIAAPGDELALGALRAAVQADITVPDQMAITRWDDDSAAPAGLTTVHQNLPTQGADCARIALDHPSSAGLPVTFFMTPVSGRMKA